MAVTGVDREPPRTILIPAREWARPDQLSAIVRTVARGMRVLSQDVGDIQQDVAMKLLKRGDVLVNARYVRMVTRSQIIDLQRVALRSGVPLPELARGVPDEELSLLVHAAVSRLGSRSQLIYRLIAVEGLTEREIAAQLNVSRGAVRRWRNRLLRRLGSGLRRD